MSPEIRKNFSAETVRELAELSHLRLTPAEEKRLVKEMGEIISYFATIDRAKVEDLEPYFLAESMEVSSREDRVLPSDREGILRIVPSKKGRHVRAPRVF